MSLRGRLGALAERNFRLVFTSTTISAAGDGVSTIALAFVTRAALRERAYSAVMAATGLLYLAILTAFGTDLVARAVLSR